MFSQAFSFRVVKDGIVWERINSLPNEKFLDWAKLKAFADNKINVTEKLKFILARVENFVGKRDNAGFQHFLHFPQCFQKAFYTGSFKVGVVWKKDLNTNKLLKVLANQICDMNSTRYQNFYIID